MVESHQASRLDANVVNVILMGAPPFLCALPNGSTSTEALTTRVPGFVDLPQPNRLSVDEGYGMYANGLSRQTTGVDFLYSDGRHHVVYAHPGDRYDFGLYMSGAYLYGQERLQVHGLPAALRSGQPGTAGSCSVWTERYSGGQRWIALSRGRVSILIVSNALSRKGLIAYMARAVCAPAEKG